MDKLVIFMYFVRMFFEFGQGICVFMLTCSIDNFYGCFRNFGVWIYICYESNDALFYA